MKSMWRVLFHSSMIQKTLLHHKCNWRYIPVTFQSVFVTNCNSNGSRLWNDYKTFSALVPIHAVGTTQSCTKNCMSSFSSFHNNHYEALGLKQSASPEEIKSAFFKLSKVHHPDKLQNADNESDMNTFLKIQKAYEVLHNKKRRTEYDMKLFGRSSHINRFSSGEYVMRPGVSEFHKKENLHNDNETNQSDTKIDEDDLTSDKNGGGESKNFYYMANLLSKLYGVIFFAGLAMYLLGRRSKNDDDVKDN